MSRCRLLDGLPADLGQPHHQTPSTYHGEAEDLPQSILQDFLDAVASGEAVVPIHRVYAFDQIVEAHAAMETGSAVGKLVVTT